VLYAVLVEPQSVSLVEVDVALKGLPADLEGLRILQVSDLESKGQGHRESQVAALGRQARADIVVITGDLVAKNLKGRRLANASREVADLLAGIPSRMGAWFVEGHGESLPLSRRRAILDGLQTAGINVLHDEVKTLPVGSTNVALVGLGLHPSGREGRFFQQPDGTIIETGRGRAESHYLLQTPGSDTLRDYEYTGEFRFTRKATNIGLTFYNSLPLDRDRFYRLRRTEDNGVMLLSPHGTWFTSGRSSTGKAAEAGVWTSFRILVETHADDTRVRARIWETGTPEPDRWSVDCVDATPDRLTEGTVGVWTSGPGRKEFRRLGVARLDGTVIMADGHVAGFPESPWQPPRAPDWILRLNERIPRDAFPIALSHTPDPFLYTPYLGWPLLLAGHTQGGQIRLPFIGALTTDTVLGRRFASGLFEQGASHLYITRGIGTTRVPFRFLSPPELSLITLRRESDGPRSPA
jgi:predicted MPP superfamily phosphohydrolase